MNRHLTALSARILFISLLILTAPSAHAGIGGPQGTYYMAYSGPEALTLLIMPDGSGPTLDEARLPYGGTADATITLLLMDINYDPIPYYPREDIWLEAEDEGLIICTGGSIADTDTDINGETHWTNPLRGGGASEALTVVKVNGSLVELTSGVRLNFNSPDINGDLVVNLLDVALFAEDFFNHPLFSFRSDFYRDGQINIADLGVFAQAIGAACP
jgi:hypothetical protein